MITVNTNLASMLVQKNFKTSTNSLNTAIERLTTGFRINSAKDDAAGRGVAIDMDVKLSSNEVVQNNVEMGISLLNTAEGNVNLIKDKIQRCRDLCEQALNGVYDTESQNAIREEVNQLVAQINQIKDSAEFNGIELFSGSGGGRATIKGKSVEDSVSEIYDLVKNKGATTIELADTNALCAFAEYVNDWNTCSGLTFCLTKDIDLQGVAWTPIGGTYGFKGVFNGNGHTISNLSVSGTSNVGLFQSVYGTITNTAVVNATVSGTSNTGIIAGYCNGFIDNCYASGSVSGESKVGGIIGNGKDSTVNNCYTAGSIYGNKDVGGIAGDIYNCNITNNVSEADVSGNYSTGDVVGACSGTCNVTNNTTTVQSYPINGSGAFIGDFSGHTASSSCVINSTSVSEALSAIQTAVKSNSTIGLGSAAALQAFAQYASSNNCTGKTFYLTTDIDLGGINWNTISNFSGIFNGNGHTISNLSMSGKDNVGFFGNLSGTITNTGIINATVSSTGSYAGIIAGYAYGKIDNCYAVGEVIGKSNVGGVVGGIKDGALNKSWMAGTVSGTSNVGGLIGYAKSTVISNNNYAEALCSPTNSISLIGYNEGLNTIINNVPEEAVYGTSGFLLNLSDRTASGSSVINSTSVSEALSSIQTALKSSNTVGLGSAAALQAFAQYTSSNDCTGKTFYLTNDIDLGGINWSPTSYFNGTFNGNGHTISNLNVSGKNNVGFFYGVGNKGTVTNTGIINATVSGTGHVGIIAGDSNGKIDNCYAVGNVLGGDRSGGIVGLLKEGTISNSWTAGTVSGTKAGGISGEVTYNNTISNSFAYNTVSGNSSGGFIGYFTPDNNNLSGNTYYDNSTGRGVGNYSTNPSGITYSGTIPNYVNTAVTPINNPVSVTHPSSNIIYPDTSSSPSNTFTTNDFFALRSFTPAVGTSIEDDSTSVSVAEITIQIGLDGTENSRLTLDLGLDLGDLDSITSNPSSSSNLATIDNLLSSITSLETNIGANLNRLESVQDSLQTQQKTLTAARSIVQDADVSKESARYIRSQILQQASASLLTVANQAPSLLLSLINGMR